MQIMVSHSESIPKPQPKRRACEGNPIWPMRAWAVEVFTIEVKGVDAANLDMRTWFRGPPFGHAEVDLDAGGAAYALLFLTSKRTRHSTTGS